MKKFLALLLMFTFAVAPVVGCGGDKEKDKKGTEEKKDGDKKDADKKDADKKDA